MPRIKSDLLHFFEGIATDTLSECDLEIDPRSAATVIAASGGYPEKYEKGKEITGAEDMDGSILFHAGTKVSENKVLTNGGRVLACTGIGPDMETALKRSYDNIEKIAFDGMYYRKDIGSDVIREKTT